MKILMFTVYGEAQPQGSTKAFVPKGWSRPILTSTNPKLKSWRQLVAESANVALARLDKADRTILLDGVRLTIAFYLPRPMSLAKRVTAHTKKPDIDKLLRAVCDALSGVVFRDDSQICELVAVKHYAAAGALPRVDLTVEPTAGQVPLRREQPLFDQVAR
jgi:crossover junction endodeoxyribonuclease RusA